MKSAMIPKSHQASRVVVSGNTKRYGNVEGLKSNWDVNGDCITHIIKPSLFPARTLQASLLPPRYMATEIKVLRQVALERRRDSLAWIPAWKPRGS